MAMSVTPERVDEEINKYLALVSDLRSQKNSFLPIFRLPPETLANIFTHAAHDHHEGNHLALRVPHWVNVSYVCRHWRNVALSCPTLWTYHFTVSLRWTEELLARSKQASLKIRIDYDYHRAMPWWSRLVEEVLKHTNRIQELCLDIPDAVLPTNVSLNAPRLQVLDIHFRHSPCQRIFTINNGDSLPLRTLKLADCPLPWHSSFNLRGVTTLFLAWVPSQSQLNVTEFLATLARMQALTVLHLEHALPSARGLFPFGVSPKVPLPYLSRLFVRTSPSTVVALLSCMDIPLKTRIRLVVESDDNASIDDFAQLPSVLAQRFSHPEDPASSNPIIRSLIIHFSYDSEFTISASERADCDHNVYMSHHSQYWNFALMIHVTMEQLMAICHRGRIVGDICCSIPSTHVQTLHVLSPPFSPDFWKKTLSHLDGLRSMKLSYGYIPDLVSLLAVVDRPAEVSKGDVASDRGLPLDHTFVPELEELELYRITFSSENDASSGIILSEQSLRDVLSTRKAVQLTLTECDVRAEEEEEEEEGSDDCNCDLCATDIY